MVSKHEQVFEAQARRILSYLRTDIRYNMSAVPRPFMIELTGSPSSGKTTTITELYKFLRRHGFRVLRPQEGAEVIQHVPRTTPTYNIRTGIYALTQAIDYAHGHQADVVIFDRGIFDVIGWMNYWSQKGLLGPDDQKTISSFFLLHASLIDCAYIMVCEPDVAMKRELRVALSDQLGDTTNPASIAKLVDRYCSMHDEYAHRFPQLRLVNTTHLSEQEMVEKIAHDLLQTLERRITHVA